MQTLNLKRPLAFFDLETTGANVCKDRIVELSIVKVMPDGELITKSRRVNPTIPISAEAQTIHGISDDDVKGAPTFKQIARGVYDFLVGCDLGGYNVARFDIPVLIEEFSRCKIEFEMKNRRIVDGQKIFFKMEPRTLQAAHKYFCGEDMSVIGKAHSAEVDAFASYKVVSHMLSHYSGRKHTSDDGTEYEPVKNDIQHLHDHFCEDMYDLAGHMLLKEKTVVFNFGKFKGMPVLEVLKSESGYYDWFMKAEFPYESKQKLTSLRLSQLQLK